MKSVLITGCNRGIGLCLVQKIAQCKNPPNYIIATCRDIAKAETLKELSEKHRNIHILEIDVNNFETFDSFAKKVENIVKKDGLNVLINNAGISSKFTRINLIKSSQLIDNFKTNTVAPLMLTKALLPLLRLASDNNNSLPLGISRAAIINISSILGSIEQNNIGGFYPYRCSKAALNAVTKSLSLDLKDDKIMAVSIHPGWCKTKMGGSNAPLEVETAVTHLLETLNTLTVVHNGSFIQYNGEPLPW